MTTKLDTPAQRRRAAKQLYDERQQHAWSYAWTGSSKRQRFLQRCRYLASKIDVNVTYPDDDAAAMMYLDVIALRENTEFYYSGEEPTPVRFELQPNGQPRQRARRSRYG